MVCDIWQLQYYTKLGEITQVIGFLVADILCSTNNDTIILCVFLTGNSEFS